MGKADARRSQKSSEGGDRKAEDIDCKLSDEKIAEFRETCPEMKRPPSTKVEYQSWSVAEAKRFMKACPTLKREFLAVKLPDVYGICSLQYLKFSCTTDDALYRSASTKSWLDMTPQEFVFQLRQSRAGSYFEILGLAIVDIDEEVHFVENMTDIVEKFCVKSMGKNVPVGRVQRRLETGKPIGARISINERDNKNSLRDLGLVCNEKLAILVYPEQFNKQLRFYENSLKHLGLNSEDRGETVARVGLNFLDPESDEYQRVKKMRDGQLRTENLRTLLEDSSDDDTEEKGTVQNIKIPVRGTSAGFEDAESKQTVLIEELDEALAASDSTALVPLQNVQDCTSDEAADSSANPSDPRTDEGSRELTVQEFKRRATALTCEMAAARDAESLILLNRYIPEAHGLLDAKFPTLPSDATANSAMHQDSDVLNCLKGDTRKRLKKTLVTAENTRDTLQEKLRQNPELLLEWTSQMAKERVERIKQKLVAEGNDGMSMLDVVRHVVKSKMCFTHNEEYCRNMFGEPMTGTAVLKTINAVGRAISTANNATKFGTSDSVSQQSVSGKKKNSKNSKKKSSDRYRGSQESHDTQNEHISFDISTRQRVILDGIGSRLMGDSVAERSIPLLRDGFHPGPNDFVFGHVYRVLQLLMEQPGLRTPRNAEAVNAFACAVFAFIFPDVVGSGNLCKTILSGYSRDPRRDDEQGILHFYWHGDEPCVALLDDAQICVTQRCWAHPYVVPPEGLPLSKYRGFVVRQPCNWNLAKVVVEQAAVISYKIIDAHETLEMSRRQIPLQSLRHKQTEFSDHEHARLYLENHRDIGGGLAGTQDPDEPFTKKDFDWFVDAARAKKKLFICGVHFGARSVAPGVPPYASLKSRITIDDRALANEICDTLTRWTRDDKSDFKQFTDDGNPLEGAIPWSLPPALTHEDDALEDMYWQCLEDGRVDLDGDELAQLLIMEVDQSRPSKTDEILDAAIQILEDSGPQPLSSDARATDIRGCKDALSWLKDRRIRKEQRKRAEEVRRSWTLKRFGLGSVGDGSNENRSGDDSVSGLISDELLDKIEAQMRSGEISAEKRFSKQGSESADPSFASKLASDAIANVARKRNKMRHVLRGMNILRRIGVLSLESSMQSGRRRLAGVTVNVRGSHHVLHGKQGCATLVRPHGISSDISRRNFMKSLNEAVEIG